MSSPPQSSSLMRPVMMGWTCLIVLMGFSFPAWVGADVVYRMGLSTPLVGEVIQNDESGIVLRFESPQQGVPQVLIPREEIVEHIVTVDPARLEDLTDGDWDAYQNYAEELAAYRLDTRAHRLAMRLYLISAYHTEGEARMNAFRALIEIARNPEEEKRLRTLAFKVTGNRSKDLLEPPQNIASVSLADESAQNELLQCIRLVRRGANEQALALADSKSVQLAFESVSHLMTFREFRDTAYDRNRSAETLKQLVQLELALMGGGQKLEQRRTQLSSSPSWNQLVAAEDRQPFIPVQWDNVTEFDPRKSRYQEGTWELP